MHMTNIKLVVAGVLLVAAAAGAAVAQQFGARDPGVRGGLPAAGAPLDGLTPSQLAFFDIGKTEFQEADGLGEGLGPRFNLDSCGGCHSQPAMGGTSPATNPQIAVATKNGATNTRPFFISINGPVREARFKWANPPTNTIRDGGVHDLFTITGRTDA